jgi:hypothetical protein
MPIGSAVQKGSTVYVYDEKGRVLFTRSVGNGPKDGVKGFTSSTVTIQNGNTVYVFHESGRVLYTR